MRDGPVALLCVVLAGCSYDWTPGSAGASTDAATDVAPDVAPPVDATTAPDATGADAPGDVLVDVTQEGPSCAQLQAQVQQALAAALVCTTGASACTTLADDACGCPYYVGTPGQKADYEAAVTQLKTSGCPLGCSGSCGPTPQPGLCVVSEAGATTLACAQL